MLRHISNYKRYSMKRLIIAGCLGLATLTGMFNNANAMNQQLNSKSIRDNQDVSGLDKDGSGRNPIAIFVEKNDPEMVQKAIEKGFDVNNQDNSKQTALSLAVTCNNLPIVELLIEAGADPNIVDENGDNAVHIAADQSTSDIFTALTKSKYAIDFSLKDGDGLTPLEIAEARFKEATKGWWVLLEPKKAELEANESRKILDCIKKIAGN